MAFYTIIKKDYYDDYMSKWNVYDITLNDNRGKQNNMLAI